MTDLGMVDLTTVRPDVAQRIIDITLDDLWSQLNEHTEGCSWCDAHTLCAVGQRHLLAIEPRLA
jgi:hypothetical protein